MINWQLHLRIQANAESLAFHDAGQLECMTANHRLRAVIEAQEKLYSRQLLLNLVINSFDYLGSIMSYVILFVPVYFSWYDNMDPTQICVLISQNAFLFIYLISVVNSFLVLWEKITSFAITCNHVDELLMNLGAMSVKHRQSQSQVYEKAVQESWVLESVTIMAPETNHIILQDFSLRILLGENVLFVGARSSGKTSILRILRGLWQPSFGHVECSLESLDIFFLPQVPVFTSGCLKDQITYPERTSNGSNDEAFFLELLHLVDMESLLFHSGGLETPVPWEWGDFLSRQEQQAVSFLRALYHQPKVLVADEATDSLLASVEDALMQRCHELGISLVMTTVNSERLSRFHHKIVMLNVSGDWTVVENKGNMQFCL